MIVHCDSWRLLCLLLSDHILIQISKKVLGFRHTEFGLDFLFLLMQLLFEDTATHVDATVTNVDPGTGDQFFDFCMALSAEGTHREIRSSCHV